MKRMLTAALALLLALSLCACGAQDTDDTPTYPAAFSGLETLIDTAREEGRLTVFGTGDEAYMTALCEKFEELFDIKTTYRAITAAQAGSARGDVWFGGSADTCRSLAADGKLLTYTPVHAADLTNAAYGDADGYWYGVSVDAVVFAVNSDVLRRMTISAPKDWADLTDPVYQELIWLPTYRSTEIGRLTAYSAALRLGRDKGLDYLAALDTSVQFYTAADDTFVKCLSTGECVIAVGWLHDGLSALSADTSGDLHLIIPASGTFGQVTASAILSGASHTAAAQLWQEFVLSPACADLAEAHGDYRLPTIGSADLVQRTGVTLAPSLPPAGMWHRFPQAVSYEMACSFSTRSLCLLQQLLRPHAKELRQRQQIGRAGIRLPGFPLGYRLPADTQRLRHKLLRHFARRPTALQCLSQCFGLFRPF